MLVLHWYVEQVRFHIVQDQNPTKLIAGSSLTLTVIVWCSCLGWFWGQCQFYCKRKRMCDWVLRGFMTKKWFFVSRTAKESALFPNVEGTQCENRKTNEWVCVYALIFWGWFFFFSFLLFLPFLFSVRDKKTRYTNSSINCIPSYQWCVFYKH